MLAGFLKKMSELNCCSNYAQGDAGEDDDDAEAIPSCWLPYESGAGPGGGGGSKKSPLLLRGTSTPPKIIKASLKSFSGLEVCGALQLQSFSSHCS